MVHIAILRKAKIKENDDLLGDILAGKKTIESRWYVNKVAPWNKIEAGDIVYFKESGSPITAKALVSQVLQYENLTDFKVSEIIDKYGCYIAPNTSKTEFSDWWLAQKGKRYCILVFLESIELVEPFNIDKSGFGVSAAWLTVGDINKVKIL